LFVMGCYSEELSICSAYISSMAVLLTITDNVGSAFRIVFRSGPLCFFSRYYTVQSFFVTEFNPVSSQLLLRLMPMFKLGDVRGILKVKLCTSASHPVDTCRTFHRKDRTVIIPLA